MGSRIVHISWRIAAASAAFVLGVASALFMSVHFFVAMSMACVLPLVMRMPWLWTLPGIVVCVALLGNSYGGLYRLSDSPFRQWTGSSIELSGTVKEDPSKNQREATVYLSDIRVRTESLEGTLWTRVPIRYDIVRGDTVTLTGVVGEGFGTFVATLNNAQIVHIERPVPGDVGRRVREWFSAGARAAIDEPYVSLGLGYLTGQKSALSESLTDALQIAGLTHIVVASGYNLTILVRLARRLFVRHSVFSAFWSAAGMIIAFVSVTGLSPSMTRAGLVSGLSLLAWRYGRRFHPLVLLPFAAMLTVVWQPSYAWGDVGWLLSFSAFFGVMILAPLLQAYFFGRAPPGTLRQVLGETFSAQLATLPVIVVTFGVLSNVAIMANAMIVPLVPLAMLGTFLAGIFGLVLPADIASFLATPVEWLLGYMVWCAEWWASLPWAQTELTVPWWGIAIYCLLLLAACIHMWRVTKYSLRSSSIVE